MDWGWHYSFLSEKAETMLMNFKLDFIRNEVENIWASKMEAPIYQ